MARSGAGYDARDDAFTRSSGMALPLPTRVHAWLTLPLLAAGAAIQQPDRRVEPEAMPVRYSEGMVHGFLRLETASGTLLAHGDLLQVPKDRGIESRMVFHFADSSVFDERVTFTQHGVFAMQEYHLVQKGPAFERDLEVTLSRTGQYKVSTRSHKDGEVDEHSGVLTLPPDVYNGMVITIAKNLAPGDTQTVHIVAFTPKPRLIGLELAPAGTTRVMLGRHAETAVHYKLKPKLGTVTKLLASILGKDPPDSDAWIVTDGVPAFVRFQGPMYSGPVWRLSLASPTWPQ